MIDLPLKTFGFEYEYAGSRYATHLLASCLEEAQARMSKMADAKCQGEISPVPPGKSLAIEELSLSESFQSPQP